MSFFFLMVLLVVLCVCESVFSWPPGRAMELYFIGAVGFLASMVDILFDKIERSRRSK